MAEPQKDTARPEFFIEAIQNASLSEKEGRPIFEERELVRIHIPGQRDNCVLSVDEVIVGIRPPMTAKERWSDYYAAFKRGEMRAATGTPLEHWPPLTKGRVAELKAAGILSVEEYASVPDNLLGKLGMGAREEREKARAFLDAAKGGAETGKLAAEVARLTAMVEALSGATTAASTATAPKAADKAIEDCTDAELKEFIKNESGEGIRGNPTRETLLKRVGEIVVAKQAA